MLDQEPTFQQKRFCEMRSKTLNQEARYLDVSFPQAPFQIPFKDTLSIDNLRSEKIMNHPIRKSEEHSVMNKRRRL